MYGSVPITTPSLVRTAVSVSYPAAQAGSFDFARPKSSTFTRPSAVSITLPGFRSRCTMRLSCAAASASASVAARSSSFGTGRPSRGQLPIQRLAFDQFHRQKMRAGRGILFDGIDRDDVRMIQRRDGPRFTPESIDANRVAREIRRQQLQRHLAPERGVERAIDLAHARLRPAWQ